MKRLSQFFRETGFSQKEVECMLRRSHSTMMRRRGKLNQVEKDCLIKIENMHHDMLAMRNGVRSSVLKWFRTPNEFLGGKTPIASCRTEVGRDRVQAIIYRISDGAN